MTRKMLVDLNRCVGCWTCSMACKMGNHLADDEYRVTVRTNGSGAGIDRPSGEYPKLHMNWMPIYKKSCTFCPDRVAEGELRLGDLKRGVWRPLTEAEIAYIRSLI